MPNSILSNPSNTQWSITISDPQDSSILTYTPSWSIYYATPITGAVDLSTQLSALAQPIAYVNLKTNASTIGGSGSGTVIPSPQYALGYFPNAGTVAKMAGNPGASVDPLGNLQALTGTFTGGNPGIVIGQSTAPPCVANSSVIYFDSATQSTLYNQNCGGFGPINADPTKVPLSGGTMTGSLSAPNVTVTGQFKSPTSGGWRPALTGVIEDRKFGLSYYVRPEFFCLLQGTQQSCASGLYDEAKAWNQALNYLATNATPGYGKVLLITNTPQARTFSSTNYLVPGPQSGPDYHGFGGMTTTPTVGLTVLNGAVTGCLVSGGSGMTPSANYPVQIVDPSYQGTGATATVQTNSSGVATGCIVGNPGINYPSTALRTQVIAIGGDGATATMSLSGGTFTVNASNATTTTGGGYLAGTPVGIPIGTGFLQCTTYPTFSAIAAGNLTGTGISTFANTTTGAACTYNGVSTATVPVYFGNSCGLGQCTLAPVQTPVMQPCAVAVRAGVRIQGVGLPYIRTNDIGGTIFGVNSLVPFCDPFGDQTNNQAIYATTGTNGIQNSAAGPVIIDGLNVNAYIGFDFAGPLSGVQITNTEFNGGAFVMAPAAFAGAYGPNLITNDIVTADSFVICGGYWNTRDPYTQASGSLGGAFWLNKSTIGSGAYSAFGAAANGLGFTAPANFQNSYCSGMKYDGTVYDTNNGIYQTTVGGSGLVLSTVATSGVLSALPTIVTAGTNYYVGSVARIGTTDATVIVTGTSTGGVPTTIAIQNPGLRATTSGSASTSTSFPAVDIYVQHYLWQTQHNPVQSTYEGTAIPQLFQSGLNCPYGPDAPTPDYLATDFQFGSTASSTNYPFNVCFTGVVGYGIAQLPRYNFSARPGIDLRISNYTMGAHVFRGNIAYADTLRLDWSTFAYNGGTGFGDPYKSTLSTNTYNPMFTILSRSALVGTASDVMNTGTNNGSILGVNATVGGALTTTGLTFRNVLNQTDQTTEPLVGATLGSVQYGSGAGTAAWLSGNITASKYFLCQTGTGTVSAAPAWCNILGGANTWTATQTFAAIVATQLSGLTSAVTPNAAGGTTLGTAALPFSSGYIGAAATNNVKLTGTFTAARTATFQDATGNVSLAAAFECGTTTTCSKTLQTNPIAETGTVTLSSGTATVTTLQAYSATTSMYVIANDTTAANYAKCVPASTTSLTCTGTGTDTITYFVWGH